ncbi:hypothetical protein F0562_002844 [Nyssa sinensis]|uniref:Response regulatory domain-containing protein n=1 Tax=Nyssa sinensis TaxID=561372 RepID=A0A5J5BXG1_9ASTE|nr:hypothetical protein F0562_002844 [Nyssa sinensis]
MDLNSEIHEDSIQEQQKHFHVLAVDDSLIDRKLLERLLTISSYQVTCVDSGKKALEYLGLLDNTDNDSTANSSSSSCTSSSQQEVPGTKVNLIMTDYSMPEMSGYDLLKRVKGSSWKNIPVVLMSSENVPSRIDMCLEGGAEEFLLKPVQLSDLRKLQSHLLNFMDIENNNKKKKKKDDEEDDDNDDNSNNKNENNAYKRKAMSIEPSERRPNMKELVVV